MFSLKTLAQVLLPLASLAVVAGDVAAQSTPAPLTLQVYNADAGSFHVNAVLVSGKTDAVLLDITMDDMDGWRTARSIRQAGFTDVPIIMVSANVFENRPENLAAAQCQAFEIGRAHV